MKPYGVDDKSMTALRRSMAVLRIITRERQGSAFSKLRTADENLSAASLSRLLKAMACEGLVRKDEMSGLYHLGESFLSLAREATASAAMPSRERIRPLVESLARETGESAVFFEPEGDGMILGAKVELPERFHYIEPFQRIAALPAHGAGQVLLAWSSDERRKALLAANAPVPAPVKAYRKRLAQIQSGLVLVPDWGEGNRNMRVLAPVSVGESGMLAGVIGVSFWEQEYTGERMRQLEESVCRVASLGTRLLQA